MSAISQGQAGMAALEKKNWTQAIELLSQALNQVKSPAWLLGRAQAYQQTKQFDLALPDVELAYHAAAERGNDKSRKQMIEAQYRRAVILFKKGQYADSDCCCVWAQQLAEGKPVNMDDTVSTNVDENGDYKATVAEAQADRFQGGNEGSDVRAIMENQKEKDTGYKQDWNRAYMWRTQALSKMEQLPAGHPGRKVTVTRVPTKPTYQDVTKEVKPEAEQETTAQNTKENEKPQVNLATVPRDLRFQFYQSDASVTVEAFIKNTDKDKLEVKFLSDSVVLSGLPRDPPHAYLRLAGPIRPAECKFRVASMKIELTLVKETPGKWGTWGQETTQDPRDSAIPSVAAVSPSGPASVTEQVPSASTVAAASQPTAPATDTKKPAGPPAYPTSSKTGPKNWDSFAEDGDDDEKDEADKDPNFFFKQLYKNATPEQQRAMMKSFTESNGTSLSTDWDDVKSRIVETVPPDGVEAKKWDA
ncbi:SGS-domain-containing protein [Pleurostoma richardsiae]|uniref:SGS-domain-containing protein n=1 Tax=Pleurostoma richardsiae TaxID=41990 RepID=A0AA38RAP7_9PEZI|nr:SGS-domain-containing protein [Pleurostoma richardsiae]